MEASKMIFVSTHQTLYGNNSIEKISKSWSTFYSVKETIRGDTFMIFAKSGQKFHPLPRPSTIMQICCQPPTPPRSPSLRPSRHMQTSEINKITHSLRKKEFVFFLEIAFNQHFEQVLESSRHCSSYGLLVTIKIVNLILAEEYNLKSYSLLVLMKITKLILSEKYTVKSIAQSIPTVKMILH